MDDIGEQYDLVMLCFWVRKVQRQNTHEMRGSTTQIVRAWYYSTITPSPGDLLRRITE